jgi:ubiquinone/menaquinone biosynthesis C-methylase UbiE
MDVQRHFDEDPYPGIAVDCPVRTDAISLYEYCVSNAFYARDRRVVEPAGMRILDAGCGTGYRTLLLAAANPGAQVMGIDWSQHSIEMAQQRCERQRIADVEFRTCAIETVADLGLQFDYIYCHDTLYFPPNPAETLRAMKSALTLHGIIHADLHNARQRQGYYRAQEFFQKVGIMGEISNRETLERARSLYEALNDTVVLKGTTWHGRRNDKYMLQNHLLRGDHGFTLPDVFALLREAEVTFISMADWPRWNLDALFKGGLCNVRCLLDAIETPKDYFIIYDLLNFNGRLYSFWCGRPEMEATPPVDLTALQATVHLHPILRNGSSRKAIQGSASRWRNLQIGKFVPYLGRGDVIPASMTTLIYPLVSGPLTLGGLTERWQKLNPASPITMAPMSIHECADLVREKIAQLERMGIVYVEAPSAG